MSERAIEVHSSTRQESGVKSFLSKESLLSQKTEENFGLSVEQLQQLTGLLQKYWGYGEFRPLQLQSMAACMNYRDSLTILPTGAGKSICFQLPALALEGTAVVISPLIALMKDQVDALKRRGIPADFVNSSLTARERENVMNRMSSGQLKLLYIAPERLMRGTTMRYLATQKVSFLAIDEAHCISGWGHDFRPDYRKLGELRNWLPGLPIHCFTATASPRVRGDIVNQLKLQRVQHTIADMDRPNLLYRMIPAIDKLEQICQIAGHYPGESGIVFCMSRKETERLAGELRYRKFNAIAYHAGLAAGERRRIQEKFLNGEVDLIVATVAFGMGIDKANIRFVIHTSLPQSIEQYVQECGRAGRDGLPSECVLLYRGGDRIKRIGLADDEPPQRIEIVKSEIHRMANLAATTECRRKTILDSMGQKFDFANCGACDNCLNHYPRLADSEDVIMSLLRIVKETGESRGSRFIRDIARGEGREAKDNLSDAARKSACILKRYSDIELEDFIEQMQSLELLQSPPKLSLLQLSVAGKKMLLSGAGDAYLSLRFSKPSPMQLGTWSAVTCCDKELFRICLKKLTAGGPEKGWPRSLAWQLSSVRPTNVELWRNWLNEHQMGQSMEGHNAESLQNSLDKMCRWISEYCKEHWLSSDIYVWSEFVASLPEEKDQAEKLLRLRLNSATLKVFPFFDNGMSIADIGTVTGLKASTISRYLQDYIQVRNVTDCSTWVPTEKVAAIETVIAIVGDERLKPIFEHLGGRYSYDEIRVVSSAYKVRQQSLSSPLVSEKISGES